MKEFVEGSHAVAEIIKRCRPGVVSAYPITPQTHIVEDLAQMVSNKELNAQFVNVESEHSAASVVLGGEATGVRSYTATSSQGLLLMAEVVFNIAGMRLPVVMTTANRAISAPINIWNDQQDVMVVRDSGWVLFFAESIQEAVDLHLQAYKLGEDPDVMLPVMVNMDGFILTHGMEVVDMPSQEEVDRYLPAYKTTYKLDIDNPQTMGYLADPDYYLEIRYMVQETHRELLSKIPGLAAEFKKAFGRESGGLIQTYRMEDAEQAFVAAGSVCGTIRDAIDELRAKGKKVGLVKIATYRPFPKDAIVASLKNVREVAVVDKSISLGGFGPFYTDVTSALSSLGTKAPKTSGFVLGLGGRDIRVKSILDVYEALGGKQVDCAFIGLKQELLAETK
ncbi:pyruvate:ferredoxin oxidoreductase, alpha subunit [Candidatus Velamenicoccus archaeovorus]|uniref:Pyruvate:ferredoxin oxidoreductase, alpha subunit n=1 Tax=Velamenicoccus archaeovorus TaxID=1930593 RepID=A0A410P2L4_VELA1|nr:transketolase C-terminal domain-containing protein [Candidatus Velamenicoccus archaeovorus]QAT16331.1 pyruvate:ferredoxin oxidoreductase, alpha subunit [Candidatus Velamenicoccus archaeovorus]